MMDLNVLFVQFGVVTRMLSLFYMQELQHSKETLQEQDEEHVVEHYKMV